MQQADSNLPLAKAFSWQCPIACASDVAINKFKRYNIHNPSLARTHIGRLLNDFVIPAAESSTPLSDNPDGVALLESRIEALANP